MLSRCYCDGLPPACVGKLPLGRMWAGCLHAVFLFLYFLFPFFIKIYFRYGNLQKYTPAAPLPGGRGLSAKKRGNKFADRSLGTGRPAAGRPGRPPPPLYIRVLAGPPPSFALLKIQKKEKRGRERRGEGEAKRRSLVGFSSRRL